MYMSVRKPPLSSAKGSAKPNTLRKNDAGTAEHTVHGVVPSVPKTVPPCNYARRNSGNPLMGNSQRGSALPYQTTNTLFSGSLLHGKLSEPTRNSTNRNNSSTHTGAVHDNEGSSGPVVSGEGPGNVNGRGIVGRRPPMKTSFKRNASDNVAAVLGGSTLMNGDRWGNGGTRKVFSGPPSTRAQANHGGEALPQRPHPPGSGGPKVGVRPIQFALNANSTQRLTLTPMPPRPALAFTQPRNGIETVPPLQRQTSERQQEPLDPFGTTQTLNGVGTQLATDTEGDSGLWGKSSSSPFALASVKLQQLTSPRMPPSPKFASETSIAPGSRSSVLSRVASASKLPVGAPNDTTASANKSGLQYEFRVVASTGRSFNSPIKLASGVGSLQGLRPTMEDEHFVRFNAASVAGQSVSLMGILDGHCGRRVAELAARQVPDNFIAHSALGENNALAFVESIIQADRAIFHALGKGTVGGPCLGSTSSGGSTLIAAAVHGRMLYVACLGDARAVLYDGSTTIPMSEDHKPTNRKEHTRILQCGGFVQFGRVCGILAVSRALGDYEFKFNGNRFIANRELMVSNVADVRQINLTDSSKFLLMACDGLWDVVENEEATQFVRDFLSYTPDVGSSPEATRRALNNCCQKLAEFAVDRGSTDNVSVMLLFFHNVADVVAGFDKPVGAATASSPSHTVSPRLSCPSRGLAVGGVALDGSVNNSSNGGVSGSKRASFNTSSSWYGRSRSMW